PLATESIPEERRFWTRHLHREVQYVLDLSLLVAAFALAYLLRFDFRIPPEYLVNGLAQLPVVVLSQFVIVLFGGIYAFIWRYISMAEIQPFARGAVYSTLPLLLLRFGLPDSLEMWRVPLSVIILDAGLAWGGLLALRVLRRALYERYERSRRERPADRGRRRRVLLVGAGRAGIMAVREIRNRGDVDLELAGFVDDDPSKLDSVIAGLSVLGTTADVPQLASELEVDQVVITMTEADAATIRRLVEMCERARLRVRIIPGLYELLDGSVSISRFRAVQIEDLLGRETVRLDEDELRRFLTGKTVLVTGAGGSIGTELCRQAARFNPLRLLLLDRAEGPLFEIDRELRHLWPHLRLEPVIADIGDDARMSEVLGSMKPQVVLHAAAHKHVPMMEDNPGEAVKNNTLATERLARLCGEAGCEAFVLISTDKAVAPTSIMGASKRVAELVVQAMHELFPSTRYIAVRFGNVLGSTGSVVPIFRQQIEQGGPVTVTHPEARRYFMTIAEAAQLVLEAGAIGDGGEIMILDMGKAMKIVDLAYDMIALSGFRPYDEIPIVFTGLRPGEKLNEELELSGEEIDRTLHPKIFVGRLSGIPASELQSALDELATVAAAGKTHEIRLLLDELLPEASLERRGRQTAPTAARGEELLH
ncbi:MAG: polysaccharide biosynthesis protein, partial [Thermoanaerobaculia bacterium]